MIILSNNHHIDIEWLKSEFQKGTPPEQLADKIGCHVSTIYLNLRRNGINIQDVSYKYSFKNEAWLRKQFEKYSTVTEVSRNTGIPRTSISRYAEKFGIRQVGFHRKYKNAINENYFDVIDTEHKAYWLGFFMADSYMYHKKNGKYEFNIKIKSTDYELLKQFAQDVDFDISKIKIEQKYRKDTLTESAEFRTGNQIFCNNLVKHSIIPQKGGKEIIPDSVPKELVRHFIRGYWDGDGSILFYPEAYCNPKTVQCCSMSFDILNQINSIFKENKIIFEEIKPVKTKNEILYVLKVQNFPNICKFIDYIYKDATVFLERKHDTALKILAYCSSKNIYSTSA